jgi:polysaccharide deacetylase 2 family uncharacterized protein YibQ
MSATAAKPQKTTLWWGLVGLCALLLLLQLLLSSLLVLGDGSAANRAILEGQRLWLHKDGSNPLAGQIVSPDASALLSDAASKPATKPADPTANLMAEFAADASEAPVTTPTKPASQPESFVGNESDLKDVIPAEPRTAASLTAPLDALLEPWESGALPMRDGNATPFNTYRRAFTAPIPKRPVVALLITGLGAMRAPTEAATQLPANVTLAFNPYARHTPTWLQSARNKGFESWLMLPAQPDSFPAGDAGPDALLVEQPAEEAMLRLKRTMARTAGYTGLVLPANEAFSDHLEALSGLHKQLESRGVALLAAKRPSNSASVGWFKRQRDTYAGDILIDETLSLEAIEKQLLALEATATQQGYAMGVIRAYPLSLKSIEPWLMQLERKGFTLAPASAVFDLAAE